MSRFKRGKKIVIDLTLTRAEAIIALTCILCVGFVLSYAIIAHTPLRNFIPGYPNAEVRRSIVENAMKADSLERCIYRWELYTANLRNILEGGVPVKMDSLKVMAVKEINSEDANYLSGVDSILRTIFKQEQHSTIRPEENSTTDMEGLHFFRPVEGAVTNKFILGQHPWVDFASEGGKVVSAVLDGVVIYTGWNQNDQWCVIVRHDDSLISVFRNLGSLLKKTGDLVSAGTAVALTGDNGYVHFELWRDDALVDPLPYLQYWTE